MGKHTPGPWKAQEGVIFAKIKGRKVCIATARADAGELPVESNATLIAAAPALLKALKAARQWMDDRRELAEYVQEIALADEAIAKAEKVTT